VTLSGSFLDDTFNVTKCKLYKRVNAAAQLSQLRSLHSTDNSDRPRGVAKSIIVLFSATETQTQTPVWCRTECQISRRSPKLTSISAGVCHSWWRWLYLSSSNFIATGPIFLLVPSHFVRTMTNSSLYSVGT